MTIDFLRLFDSPITVCFASQCLSKTFSSHPNCDLGPPDKKSSPCTTTLIPRSLQQNEHGLAVPRALAYASSQFAAASRVPYSDTLNLPYSGKVQSGDNMADIGTKVLDRDTIQTDSTSRVWGLLVERVCERTPSHPHLRRAADHLEQQEEPHCKPSWKGNAHAPSCDACSGKPVKRGRQQRLRAKAM